MIRSSCWRQGLGNSTRRSLIRRRNVSPASPTSFCRRQESSAGYHSAMHDAQPISYDRIPPRINDQILSYAQQTPTLITLQKLLKTGRGDYLEFPQHHTAGRFGRQLATERILIQVAAFLQRELPVRLAHRILDLDRAPRIRDMPSVQHVKGIYIHSFLDLLKHSDTPITNLDLEQEFYERLSILFQNHSVVLVEMAKGAYELRSAVLRGEIPGVTSQQGIVQTFAQMDDCHKCLDRFYLSRVGIRVLAGQYLALREQAFSFETKKQPSTTIPFRNRTKKTLYKSKSHHQPKKYQPEYVGIICKNCSPYHVVQQAIADATRLCQARYGSAPDVEISGRLDLTFPYIPTHLHYILLELLKNAFRATMDFHAMDLEQSVPPVSVIIADGAENEDVVIKVSDQGGGIPRSQLKRIWSYLYTTASPSVQETFINGSSSSTTGGRMSSEASSSNTPILAGLGYGLPLSRAYLRYFGGDLDIESMEGYGTDAYVNLVRLGDKAPMGI